MSLSIVKEAIAVLDNISNLPTGPITFTKAVMAIFNVIGVILESEGAEGWHKTLNEAFGSQVLTPEDEKRLEPITQLLLHIKGSKSEEPIQLMRGGADKGKDKKGEGGLDMNAGYRSFVQTFQNINNKVASFALGNGITKYENQYDEEKDLYPFGQLYGLTPVGTVLSYVPLPFRSLIFLIHTALDLIRLVISSSGVDSPFLRQMLSVSLAGMEVLRGDWKKALLSMAGFFSQKQVWPGFIGKVFLDLFYMISPKLQNDIVYGAFSVTKSLIMGILLNLFKITATFEIRMKAIKFIKDLSKREGCLDVVLKKAGLPRRSMITSALNVDGAHAFFEDPAWNCSEEFKSAIDAAKSNFILKVMLQFANIPTSEKDLEAECERFRNHVAKEGYNKWADLLAAEGLMKLIDRGEELEVDTEKTEDDGLGGDENDADVQAFRELQAQLKGLEERFKKAMDDENEAEQKMREVIGHIQQEDAGTKRKEAFGKLKSGIASRLPSMPSVAGIGSMMPTSLPSMGSSTSPVQVNINFPGSQAGIPTVTPSSAVKMGVSPTAPFPGSPTATPVTKLGEGPNPKTGLEMEKNPIFDKLSRSTEQASTASATETGKSAQQLSASPAVETVSFSPTPSSSSSPPPTQSPPTRG